MKLWVLFAVHFEHDWGHGLDEVVGATLDEEEALELKRRMTVDWYRAHMDDFARIHSYDLERDGNRKATDLDDEELYALCELVGSERYEVRELDVPSALHVDGLTPAQRLEAVRGFAELLRAFHPAAAKALEEEAC